MVLYLIIALDFLFQKVGGDLIDDGAINHATKAIGALTDITHLQTCSICLLLSHCANRAACYAISPIKKRLIEKVLSRLIAKVYFNYKN